MNFNVNQPLLIALVVVYGLLILGYSYYYYKKARTFESYNLGGRAMPFIPILFASVGTGLGGATLLGFTGDAYQFGMGQIWLAMSFGIGSIMFALFLIKPIREVGDKYKPVSMGDYAAIRYGNAARLPTFIANIIGVCSLTGMQFIALATVLNLIFDMDIVTGMLIAWVFLTLKTYLGGLNAVIRTDVIQGSVVSIGLIVMFIMIYISTGGWSNVVNNPALTTTSDYFNTFNIGLSEILIPLFTMGAAILVRQETWQRVWAAKDLKTALVPFWLGIPIINGLGVVCVLMGVLAYAGLGIMTEQPNLVYYDLIFGVLPTWMGAIMFVALFAAILSTADTYFVAGSTLIVSDIIKPLLKEPTDARLLFYSRMSVLIMSVISLILAFIIPNLIALMITGAAFLVAGSFAPIVIGLFWKKPNNRAGVASMWTGLIAVVIWQLAGKPYDIHPVFIGFPLSLAILLIFTFIGKDTLVKQTGKLDIN